MNITVGVITAAALATGAAFMVKSANAVHPAQPAKVEHKESVPPADVLTYMQTMRSFLQTPPRDEVFGSDRIPTLHNKETTELDGYAAIEKFSKGNRVRSILVGFDSIRPRHKDEDFKIQNRVSDVHFENFYVGKDDEKNYEEWKSVSKFMLAKAEAAERSNSEFGNFPVEGIPKARIYTLPVKASEDSCYKCHSEKKGKAIGYLAVYLEKL